MKRIVLVILLMSVLLLAVACTPQAPLVKEQVTEEGMAKAAENEGRVVFTITDAAADMGTVTSVMLTVDRVQVHNAAEGWVTVSSEQKTFDLLKLKAEASQELLADVDLKEGDYQQLRLDISNVVVVDDKGEHEAKLPSGELKIVGGFTVTANSTSTAAFDFLVDESLHVTGNGEYILAPVVKLETREDAEVEVKADKKVVIKGGKVKANLTVGMDVDGNVGVGLKIAKDAKVSLGKGKIAVETGIGLGIGKKDEEKDTTAEETNASASVKVSVGY